MADGTVVLSPFDKFAGARGFFQNLQVAQRQQRQQQALQQFLQQQGIQAPINLPPELLQNLILQQQRARPTAPTIGGLRAREAQRIGAVPGTQEFERIAEGPIEPKAVVSTKGSFQQIPDPDTGQQINALINPVTGNIIKKFGTVAEGLSAKDKVQVAVTQAKEFRADPRIENLGIVERSERGMTAALNQARKGGKANRIASDQALGVLFQKMLDPTSVVRESEFARTPQGASMINRITGSIKQLVTGGLGLEDEDRQALVDMAKRLLQEAKISANKAFDEFSIRADEIGLNKKIVFGGAKKFDIAEEQLPITATNPRTGKKIQSFDGGQTWQPMQ